MAQAMREIHEETGLGEPDVRLVRQGEPLEVLDPEHDVAWRVNPFLFAVRDPSLVRLDWEHTESRWIDPGEMRDLETVPQLEETWERVCKA